MLLIALCFAGFIEGAAGFGILDCYFCGATGCPGLQPASKPLCSPWSLTPPWAPTVRSVFPETTGAAIGNVDLGHLSNQMVWVCADLCAYVPVLVVAIQDGLRGIRG